MSDAAYDICQRHRLTVAEYYRMAEVGILSLEARVELIEGEIINMSPIGSLPVGSVFHLAEILRAAVGSSAFVWVQNPIRLGQHSESQIDIALRSS